MENNLIIAVILIVTFIGILIYRNYLPRIKGIRGENSVARLLRKLDRKQYKIFNNIYLKADNKTTQIDHLIISVFGIFVIETKNYQGWIHGSESSEYWTQSIYKEKRKFRNPIKQNWAHIYFLKNILQNHKQIKYYSIIVFVGEAELKNVFSTIPVIYKYELLASIKENKAINLSIDQVGNIVDQVNEFKINEKEGKKKHKNYVKKNIKDRKRNVRSFICPNCKGKLVVRNGPYGKFYGCSNFPECKFLKKI